MSYWTQNYFSWWAYFPSWVSLPTPYTFQLLSLCLFPFFTAVFLGLPSPCDFSRPNCSYKTVVPCSQLNNNRFHFKVALGSVFGVAFKVMKWDFSLYWLSHQRNLFLIKTDNGIWSLSGLWTFPENRCLLLSLSFAAELWHRCCACLLFLIDHVVFLAFFQISFFFLYGFLKHFPVFLCLE